MIPSKTKGLHAYDSDCIFQSDDRDDYDTMGDSVRGEEGKEEAFVALFSREMTPFASHCELN